MEFIFTCHIPVINVKDSSSIIKRAAYMKQLTNLVDKMRVKVVLRGVRQITLVSVMLHPWN